jgi:hypothetical protein
VSWYRPTIEQSETIGPLTAGRSAKEASCLRVAAPAAVTLSKMAPTTAVAMQVLVIIISFERLLCEQPKPRPRKSLLAFIGAAPGTATREPRSHRWTRRTYGRRFLAALAILLPIERICADCHAAKRARVT